jgi:hypothetical protein
VPILAQAGGGKGMAVIDHNIKGSKARLNILRMHRLLRFEDTFDKYLAGQVPASYVTSRAKLMLEIGLPRLK